MFFCSNKDIREKDKRDHLMKNTHAETRTNCQVRLQIKFDRGSKKYKVMDFIFEHNHPLQMSQAHYLIPSQHEVSEVSCIDIHLADSSKIQPKKHMSC
jgi:FAR1 DNA-binding domain